MFRQQGSALLLLDRVGAARGVDEMLLETMGPKYFSGRAETKSAVEPEKIEDLDPIPHRKTYTFKQF